MMEFPKPKEDDEQAAENVTERKQVCISDSLQFYLSDHCFYAASLDILLLCNAGADSRKGL